MVARHSQNSFDHVDNWLAEIAKYTNENPMKLLVGSRCDLADQRVVTTEQGAEVARRLGVGFFETSAKDGTKVSDAFLAMARDLLKLAYVLRVLRISYCDRARSTIFRALVMDMVRLLADAPHRPRLPRAR